VNADLVALVGMLVAPALMIIGLLAVVGLVVVGLSEADAA
jgi:hypothetical protein